MAFLPQADIVAITKKVRFSAQRRALTRLGYKFIVAANGEPLLRAEALDGSSKPARNHGPRWDLLNRV